MIKRNKNIMLRLIFQRFWLMGVLHCVLLGNLGSAWAEEKPLFQKTQCSFAQAPAALQQRLSCGRLSVKSADGSPLNWPSYAGRQPSLSKALYPYYIGRPAQAPL